ncbi:MAG: hypothetical protein MUO27_03945 [Sedimentisphaerales bacterium]|nr:hypothetical protein [Sedimentisphaerales bacterium]
MRKLIAILVLLLCSTAQALDYWRVLPIRSQFEYDNNYVGGEGMQNPMGITRCEANPNYIYWAHDGGGPWRSTNR